LGGGGGGWGTDVRVHLGAKAGEVFEDDVLVFVFTGVVS